MTGNLINGPTLRESPVEARANDVVGHPRVEPTTPPKRVWSASVDRSEIDVEVFNLPGPRRCVWYDTLDAKTHRPTGPCRRRVKC